MGSKYEPGPEEILNLQVKPFSPLSSWMAQKLCFNRDPPPQCEGPPSKGERDKQTERETAPCAEKRVNNLHIRRAMQTAGCAGVCAVLQSWHWAFLIQVSTKGPLFPFLCQSLMEKTWLWLGRNWLKVSRRLEPTYPLLIITVLKTSTCFNCCLSYLKVILRSNTTKFKAWCTYE